MYFNVFNVFNQYIFIETKYFKLYYFQGYLSAILNAIYEDRCNVIGYGVWSFLDSFEWFFGYK